MAFPLAAGGPGSVAITIGQALESKRQEEERPVAFGFEHGSPQKRYSARFAGDIFGGNLGLDGDFAGAVNNPENKEAREKVGAWAQQWANGPFGPDLGAPV